MARLRSGAVSIGRRVDVEGMRERLVRRLAERARDVRVAFPVEMRRRRSSTASLRRRHRAGGAWYREAASGARLRTAMRAAPARGSSPQRSTRGGRHRDKGFVTPKLAHDHSSAASTAQTSGLFICFQNRKGEEALVAVIERKGREQANASSWGGRPRSRIAAEIVIDLHRAADTEIGVEPKGTLSSAAEGARPRLITTRSGTLTRRVTRGA